MYVSAMWMQAQPLLVVPEWSNRGKELRSERLGSWLLRAEECRRYEMEGARCALNFSGFG